MKIRFTPLIVIVSALFMLSSCLSSDNDNNYDYYEDTAISAFSLGTLNRYLHTTTSSGEDSVYTTTVTGSNYEMTIDHMGGKIYNTDSLPYGTDVEHVIASVTAVNNGLILIKNVDSDSLKYYSSTDSIDFSTPRVFRIISQDGLRYADYTVTVNVRKVPAGTLAWEQKTTDSNLAALTDTRAYAVGSKVFVFGTENGEIVGYSTDVNDGATWTKLSTTLPSGASIVQKGDSLYSLSNGTVALSADGDTWTTVATTSNLKSLVASSTAHLYAIKTDDGTTPSGIAMSADNGATWTDDEIDGDSSLLPDDGVAFATTPLRTNDSIDQVLIVGRCSTLGTQTAYTWTRLDDYSSTPVSTMWNYVESDEKTDYALGDITTLAVTVYGGYPVALSGDDSTVSSLLISYDSGLTWKDSGLSLPSGLTATDGRLAMTTDSEGSLWIISDGKVWKN